MFCNIFCQMFRILKYVYDVSGKLIISGLLFILFSFIPVSEVIGKDSKALISPVPSWVILKKTPIDFVKPDNKSYGGYYYLLVDIQENISVETTYSHFAIKLFNSDGIQNMSDISVSFDPQYQKLRFHEINCYRDGRKINELNPERIKIIQREPDMEKFMYDGELTAIINLSDIREGDIVEYSYSVQGYNPVYKGAFCRNYMMEYSDPVKELFRRIVCPKSKSLNFNYPNGKIEPKTENRGEAMEYLWERADIPAHIYDNNVPAWFNNNLNVGISSYSSWADVAGQCMDNYSLSDPELKKLKSTTKVLFKECKTDSVLVPAIRFVQDKIRYLGLESGTEGLKPMSPLKVLETRYADCKAKSLLLSSILNLYGIEAYPVLVNTQQIRSSDCYLPSPFIFNHTIVQVVDSGMVFYIDPTLSNQGGLPGNIYFPDYGYGLVLREGTDSLTRLVNNVKSLQRINNYFSMDSIGGKVRLKVLTEYSGLYADNQRSYFQENSSDEAVKNYLKFYSKIYPGIQQDEPLIIQDDRVKNKMTVEEYYLIDSLWSHVENKSGELQLTVSPQELKSAVSIPSSPARTMPYLLTFPSDYSQDIYINLPVEWTVNPSETEIRDSVFLFRFKSSYNKKQIRLQYNYSALSDNQSGRNFQAFYAKHEKIYDHTTYTLTYSKNDVKPYRFSWLAGLIFIVILAASIMVAVRIYRKYNLNIIPEGNTGIGSWLVLVAIGLAFSSIATINTIFFNPGFFDQKTWSVYLTGSTRNLGMFSIICFEFVYNILKIIFLILIQFLFYNRRNTLPKLIIILYAVSVFAELIDSVVAWNLAPDLFTSEQKSKGASEIFTSILYASVWITYFLKSKRVRTTFIMTSVPVSAVPVQLPHNPGLNPDASTPGYISSSKTEDTEEFSKAKDDRN